MSRRRKDGADYEMSAYYLAEVKKIPLLSAEQEAELARAIKNGSTAARDKLVLANLRLVIKIAYEYYTPDVSLMDLIQEGNIGLTHAAEKYDDQKAVRFSTYSAWWIKQAISRFIESKKRAIRLPNRKEEQLRKINYTYYELSQKFAHPPSNEEIAKAVGIKTSEVRFLLERSGETVSFDGDMKEDDSFSVAQITEDYTYSPEENYLRETSHREVLDFLSRCLPEKEKNVVLYRYQFNGCGEPQTLQKIGERIGVSSETVRQIEIRALRRIKHEAGKFAECLYA
ncbi:MAG: RNA polymerase sigma factor RpoD/SigA [Spirochaetaceae bacterium]|jgi:RNA polymerase primary sigma factor|nr:RNA polymerase sigma factor RpoD/SigA [Spirochaetaceae bacterium]